MRVGCGLGRTRTGRRGQGGHSGRESCGDGGLEVAIEQTDGADGPGEQAVSAHRPQPPQLKSGHRRSTWTDDPDPLPVDSVRKIITVRLRFIGHLLWVRISSS